MDIHKLPPGATLEDVGKAHEADVKTQQKYGVHYHKYWASEGGEKVFCLVDAPSADAAIQVHAEAHGLVAEKIIEVDPDLAEGFLGGGDVHSSGVALMPGSASDADPGIRTVLFTDIVGSTALTQRHGDDIAMEFLRVHDTIVRDALAASKGREVKHTGDGIMASFVSAAAAVRCAAQIQRELARHEQERRAHQIKVRIGGAAGEPVDRDNDIFGATVQLASRLCSHAEADQILVSNVVAELCIGKGLAFRALGGVSLKGFDRPVHVHVVEWLGEAAAH